MRALNHTPRPGIERRAIGAVAAVIGSILWTHGLAVVTRPFGPDDAAVAAWPLTVAAIVVAVVGSLTAQRRYPRSAVVVVAALTAGLLELLEPGVWAAGLALVPAALAASEVGRRLVARLPADLDGAWRRHRVVSLAWVGLAALTLVQMARLATFMSDPESDWFLTTRHPFWAKHECATAYVYGAELAQRGEENLYDAVHFPGLNAAAEPVTRVQGLAPEDPYQYPPQFLLLPSLALALTSDYTAIRVVWFAAQTTLFLAIALWLAVWIGGREGRLAAFLVPLALISFPALHNFQYGQFHLLAIALAVAGFVAFDERRRLLGGALLGVAILAKIFPVLMVVPLLIGRRWRDLASTAGWMAALTVLALMVLGPAPFVAFLDYQLPRLQNGQAFSFGDAWPEIQPLLVAANQGFHGLVVKLSEMGVIGLGDEAIHRITQLLGLCVLLVTGLVSLQLGKMGRLDRAASWLAILGLGSLLSTGAWGDYVPVAATWLMTLLVARMARRRWLAAGLIPCWLFQFLLVGIAPIGDWFDPRIMIPVSALAAVMLLTIYGWALAGSAAPMVAWASRRPLQQAGTG